MKLKLPVQFMNQKLKLTRIDESRANYTLHQSCQSMHMGGVLIHLSESNLLIQFTTKICSDLFLILTPKHTEQFSWSWTKCYSVCSHQLMSFCLNMLMNILLSDSLMLVVALHILQKLISTKYFWILFTIRLSYHCISMTCFADSLILSLFHCKGLYIYPYWHTWCSISFFMWFISLIFGFIIWT